MKTFQKLLIFAIPLLILAAAIYQIKFTIPPSRTGQFIETCMYAFEISDEQCVNFMNQHGQFMLETVKKAP